MKIALVSDIHSNFVALKAVAAHAEKKGAQDYWCIGDTVGYGPEPGASIAWVRKNCSVVIGGNHDLGTAGSLELGDFHPYAAVAIEWTQKTLKKDEMQWLKTLKLQTVAKCVTFVHGSLQNPAWEYVSNPYIANAVFRLMKTRLCIVGHTHIPFVCKEEKNELPNPFELSDKAVSLKTGRHIINPGSVGQPRDGNKDAAYALLDTVKNTVQHFRVAYDIAMVQKQIAKAGLPAYLGDRLMVGA